jgi:hypothetical protein
MFRLPLFIFLTILRGEKPRKAEKSRHPKVETPMTWQGEIKLDFAFPCQLTA